MSKKKVIYKETYNKGTCIKKNAILEHLNSELCSDPEILEAAIYEDDSEYIVIKITLTNEYLTQQHEKVQNYDR